MKTSFSTVEELMRSHFDTYQEMFDAIRLFASQSASDREQLTSYVDEHPEPSQDNALKMGLFAYILNLHQQVISILKSAPESKDKRWLMGLSYKMLGDYSKSLADFDRAKSRGWDEAEVLSQIVEAHRLSGDLKSAQTELNHLKKAGNDGLYYYQAAGLAEATGDIESALDNLQQSVDKSPHYVPAIFRLAFLTDLNGDEETAISLYKQCVKFDPININAALNLAVLYEDMGKYENALVILEQILNVYPNHARAKLFLKDIQSSMSMFYDEESEKKRDKFQQVLDMPISDFELSVRSRNCLKKMGIKTLGDLTRITESELLSYKNFGETSLNEIKIIMTSKGLRLGQAVEDKASRKAASILPGESDTEVPSADQTLLVKSIDDLQLSVRSRKCLQRLNVNTVGDLLSYSESQLMSVKNFGQISLKEVLDKIQEMGLSLR
jgi:DNA-directed RNA polymerase subunit alpha